MRHFERCTKTEESKAKPIRKKLGKKSKEMRNQTDDKQEKQKRKKSGKCK